MPKAWKRRGREESLLRTVDADERVQNVRQIMRRLRADRYAVAAPLTYPELRAEQIRTGDLERKAWEKQREREWERAMRGRRVA